MAGLNTDSTPGMMSLDEWLVHLEKIHLTSIELGLERINKVKNDLNLTPKFPVIIVGGTNGKGSVCSILESILSHAGYRVGCYTSPHLLRYNERIRIDRKEVGNDDLCRSFGAIESVRIDSGTSLTYFEFSTLAAMHLFVQSEVDIAILEVGLGGRLDATNVFDADCAILSSIGLDHMDYLGHTREAIGFEKAGIFRHAKFAICSEPNAPTTIAQQADAIGANLLQINDDFGYIAQGDQWRFWGACGKHYCLPYPSLRGENQFQNASACLMALDTLRKYVPVSISHIRQGLLDVQLSGRFQVFLGQPIEVVDVAHNPDAARVLANNLESMGSYNKTYAVFSMLKDKDIAGVVEVLKQCVDIWLVSPLNVPRGASGEALVDILEKAEIKKNDGNVIVFPDPIAAYGFACEQAANNDRICVLGSFYTVSAVLQHKNITRCE